MIDQYSQRSYFSYKGGFKISFRVLEFEIHSILVELWKLSYWWEYKLGKLLGKQFIVAS